MINYKAKIYHLYESEEIIMDFLDKLERKYGRFSIPNLMFFIMIGQGITLITLKALPSQSATALLSALSFNPYLILRGQIWRLVSYVFLPCTFSLFNMIFAILFYTYVGRMLEQSWGTFRLNLYYLSGMLFNVLGFFLVQKLFYRNVNPVSYYTYYSSQLTNYLNLSLFLAYAAIFPELEVMLFYLFPIKVKYLAVIDIIVLIMQFLSGDLTSRIILITSMLNFILYFGSIVAGKKHLTPTQKKFRKDKKNLARRQLKQGPPIEVAFHKCTVCGKTELTDPDMEFRYCSKCNGNYEYCMDHLHDHEHIQ